MPTPYEQQTIELASRISKLERYVEALRATEQLGFRGARVWHNANQTWTSGLASFVAFNSEIFDFGGMHDNATNNSRLTVPTDAGGYWIVTASLRMTQPTSTSASDYFDIYVTRNGSGIGQQTAIRNPAAAGQTAVTVSCIIDANAGDYFQVYVQNATAGSSDIISLAPLSAYFMAVRVRT